VKAKLKTDPRGRREVIITDGRDDERFLAVAGWLRTELGAELLERLDGPEQRYWDFRVGDMIITLHSEHYLGVSLYTKDSQADGVPALICERLNASWSRHSDQEAERRREERARKDEEMERESKRLLEDTQRLLAAVRSRAVARARRRGVSVRTFKLGDTVRIKTGAFASFTGKIVGINQARQLLKVAVEVFGRLTPIKLKFSEVDKISFND
jgi:hypothetical protein